MPSKTYVENRQIVATIGQRMREARGLCNISQEVAAARLGYANSSKLAKVEKASDTNSVPLWLILRAAKAYDVSIDYLFGLTDDWETGIRLKQEREVSTWLFDKWKTLHARDLAVLVTLHRRMDWFRENIAELTASVLKIVDAFYAYERFACKKYKHKPDEIPGLNPLYSAIMKSDAIARGMSARFRRIEEELRDVQTVQEQQGRKGEQMRLMDYRGEPTCPRA
jgi:transcriptional regulator with XRE-family HTH domain